MLMHKMNLATRLTMLRVIMIPLFIYIVLSKMEYSNLWALLVFVAASFTDFLDGYIARKYSQITKLGKFLDPLADKLLVTSALVCLVELGRLSSWVVIIILSREFIVSVFRAVAASDGIVIAASIWGKLKTNAQMAAIVALLMGGYPFSLGIVTDILVWISVALTIISGVEYVYANRQVFNEEGGES
jgi:CDP-diacylglycerol---glycerol-3-phosphate 3-phosphatidyltransferase